MPITASVACGFGAADGVAEAMWVQHCADRFGVPNAFIAAVQLDSDGLPSVLARYRELPTVRAVRQPLYWAADPIKRPGARGDYLSDPAWLRGFEQVADAGLVWDLLVYDEQLSANHNLITSFPDTTFVLEALGWPLDLSTEGFSRWEKRLSAVSEFPNVVLKLQGIALIFGTSPEAIGRWIRMALSIFGARRCMFATHYPVDHLLWDSQTMVSTSRQPSVTCRQRNKPNSSVKPPGGSIACRPAADSPPTHGVKRLPSAPIALSRKIIRPLVIDGCRRGAGVTGCSKPGWLSAGYRRLQIRAQPPPPHSALRYRTPAEYAAACRYTHTPAACEIN